MLFEVYNLYKCARLNICYVDVFCRGGRWDWIDVGELCGEWAGKSEGGED